MSAQEENPLYSDYFHWLYDRVVPVREVDGMSSYWLVCTRMHELVFKALVPHDENRIVDGANLRNGFSSGIGKGLELDQANLLLHDATVFEVLVGLAARANLMIEMDEMKWFQLFLRNLKLDIFSDWYCLNHITGRIDRILNRFNDRTYRYSGHGGGLFPLSRPKDDQRDVELWYQMGAFMTEHSMY